MKTKIVKHIPHALIVISGIALIWLVVFLVQGSTLKLAYTSPFLNGESRWADSLVSTMSTDEKIGQLIFSQLDEKRITNQQTIFFSDTAVKPGGISLSCDSVSTYIHLMNRLQDSSSLKYINFTTSATGAPACNQLPYLPSLTSMYWLDSKKDISSYIDYITWLNKLLQIDMCFALDNDFIIRFSESEDSVNVEDLSKVNTRLIKKFMSENIICGLSNYSYTLLKDTAYSYGSYSVPYRNLVRKGLSAVLLSPDYREYKKSLLYDDKTTNYFSGEFNYHGLTLYSTLRQELNADNIAQSLSDGADIVVSDTNFSDVHAVIKNLLKKGKMTEAQLNEKVRRILLAKSWMNKKYSRPLDADSVLSKLEKPKVQSIGREMAEKSMILLKNNNDLLPLTAVSKKNVVMFQLAEKKFETMQRFMDYYKITRTEHFPVLNKKFISSFQSQAKTGNILFLVTDNSFSVDSTVKETIQEILSSFSAKTNLVVIHYDNADKIAPYLNAHAVVQVHKNDALNQQLAAELIFGGIAASGRLAFALNDSMHYHHGLETSIIRLKYSIPEEAGIKAVDLEKVRNIIADGIRKGAMPGCQVFIAKDGKVIMNEAFGYQTYGRDARVSPGNLYDLASITKIAATTLAAMKMVDANRISLNDKLGRFFKNKKINYTNVKPDTVLSIDTIFFVDVNENKIAEILKERDTLHLNDSQFIAFDTLFITVTPKYNIFNVTLRELLMHNSGLPPGLPLKPLLLFKNDTVNHFDRYYSKIYIKDSASIKIAEGLYLRNNIKDTIWEIAKQMKIVSRKRYKYSDANMILLQMAMDSLNRRSMSSYVESNYYEPMGLKHMTFRPLAKFSKYNIVPTQRDEYWRRQLLRGYVHDPSAALLGGIAGNAGLFSNAHDLGVLMQMLLNKGVYGGIQYLKSSTVKLFTTRQANTHRGLGFDMPWRKKAVSRRASEKSFGHTGFTGTCVWADPDNGLIYVFLTNRIHPNVNNWRLNSYKIRERVHDAIYEAIEKGEK